MTPTDDAPIAGRVASSALTLAGRRVLITLMVATGTALVARELGAADFGQLASALALYTVALAASDFGFALVLGRDLAAEPDARGRLLRTGLELQCAWAAVLAVAFAGLGLASGVDSLRGQLLLVLAPAVLVSGLSGTRQAFLALFRTRRLAAIDVSTNALQVAAMLTVAYAGGGAVGVAVTVTAGTALNSFLVATRALKLIERDQPRAGDRSRLLRRATPLGISSLLSTVYFSIDLVLLGWIVSGSELGDYAVAAKALSLLVMVPGLVLAAALPGISIAVTDREATNALAARIWHWLLATGLPLCVAVGIFADPLVRLAFGAEYDGAVPLVRILCLAAAIALFGNVLGTLLVAHSIVKPVLVQNAVATVFNVAGVLLLAPRYGVQAAAWLAVATEAFVTLGSLYLLRGRVSLGTWLAVSSRPVLAVTGAAAAGLALGSEPYAAMPVAAGVFCLLIAVLRGWPAELVRPRRREALL